MEHLEQVLSVLPIYPKGIRGGNALQRQMLHHPNIPRSKHYAKHDW